MTLITTHWHDYASHRNTHHSVVGTLKILPGFHSPQLGNQRDVLVWLPDSYYADEFTAKRYPVIYMHDAQNLFDRATSFVGVEWQVDETMQALSRQGLEAIVVGLNHAGADRVLEYNPFAKPPKCGPRYLDFLVETVKPLIDRDFRTAPDQARTAIIGSSLGGLISLYALFHRPDVFGFAGVMSPALWVNNFAIYSYIRHAPPVPGKIYLDHGTREGSAEPMRDLLIEKGWRLNDRLMYVREEGGEHTEAAWARRLPNALRFLFSSCSSHPTSLSATCTSP
jgi:predicted alpha/beta superfamily hydrolase